METLTAPFGTTFEITTSPLELDTEAVIDAFLKTGYVYITGYPTDTETFIAFTSRFCTEFRPYVGGAYNRESIGGDNTLLSVTGGKQGFAVPLHGEMYYLKEHPQVLWFYCKSAPVKDGETTVADGIRFWNELSPATQELFRSKRLKYIRNYPDGVWQGIYQTDSHDEVARVAAANDMQWRVSDDGAVITEYLTPAFVNYGEQDTFINNIIPVIAQERAGAKASIVRLEDDSPIPDAVIGELVTVAQKITVNIPWKTGDIAMVNNNRAMHGRRVISCKSREIYVRMGSAQFPM